MSDQYLGEIRLFAFHRTPIDWLPCNGQSVSIATYDSLYSLIGTTYGGNGTTTFALPNLNGRVPVGQGHNTTTVPPLSDRTIGQYGGVDYDTLALAEVPAHDHSLQATTAADSTGTLGPTVLFAADTTNTEKHYLFPVPTGLTKLDLAASAVDMQGGGAAHLNVMPGLGLTYYICVTGGIYPSRAT
jgi:microcystin-dependent protein